MKITPLDNPNETRRQTGNQPWPVPPKGTLSGRIAGRALELKGLIQRDMATQSIETANRICDALIQDAQAVETLMQAPLTGGFHG